MQKRSVHIQSIQWRIFIDFECSEEAAIEGLLGNRSFHFVELGYSKEAAMEGLLGNRSFRIWYLNVFE
jgi:hypothetical protein